MQVPFGWSTKPSSHEVHFPSAQLKQLFSLRSSLQLSHIPIGLTQNPFQHSPQYLTLLPSILISSFQAQWGISPIHPLLSLLSMKPGRHSSHQWVLEHSRQLVSSYWQGKQFPQLTGSPSLKKQPSSHQHSDLTSQSHWYSYKVSFHSGVPIQWSRMIEQYPGYYISAPVGPGVHPCLHSVQITGSPSPFQLQARHQQSSMEQSTQALVSRL